MARQKIIINPGDIYGVYKIIEELPEKHTKYNTIRLFSCECINCNAKHIIQMDNLRRKNKSDRCKKCKNRDAIICGQQYKNWLVLSKTDDKIYKGNVIIPAYTCICMLCNNTYTVNEQSLKSLNTNYSCRSCSKRKHDYSALVGTKINRLYIESEAHCNNSDVYYNTICECGTVKQILARSIINGDTTSCGCYRNEVVSKNNNSRKNPIKRRNKKRLRRYINSQLNPLIKTRDNNTCQVCGVNDNIQLDVHHIFDIQHYRKLAETESNLITLCILCHQKKFHKKYKPQQENTLYDLESYFAFEYKYRHELLEEYNKYY